ncbi:hypothetical protein [Spirosoma linguale]|uniref:Uncharacterized protein n=1 Tax=Spirosoma linguale (strain ATCC 33905 / DSM 74 / LMG 10896 / Claus 1) TaxID=504472 RepID=D2QBW2_SPILD|nr:hypothetical protein Slin_1946 [Spirosoma linguale DSM 74]
MTRKAVIPYGFSGLVPSKNAVTQFNGTLPSAQFAKPFDGSRIMMVEEEAFTHIQRIVQDGLPGGQSIY